MENSVVVSNIENVLFQDEMLHIELISGEQNVVADKAAVEGRKSPQLSVFHQKREISYWLMNIYTKFDFRF